MLPRRCRAGGLIGSRGGREDASRLPISWRACSPTPSGSRRRLRRELSRLPDSPTLATLRPCSYTIPGGLATASAVSATPCESVAGSFRRLGHAHELAHGCAKAKQTLPLLNCFTHDLRTPSKV